MQIANAFFSTLLFFSVSLSSEAQPLDLFSFTLQSDNYNSKHYNDCAAILFEGKLLVNDYSPKEKRRLATGMKGTFTVATINYSNKGSVPVNNIRFKVAIRNDRTNTIWMYSEETLLEVRIEDILKKCEIGDRIIFMTVDQQFSLRYNEIALDWGC